MKLSMITGTSRGLGLSITKHLLSIGWNVVGIMRSAANILDSKYIHLTVDLSDIEKLTTLLTDWIENGDLNKYSELHFIHNASVFWPVNLLPLIETKDLQKSLNINFTSAAVMSQILISKLQPIGLPLKITFISSPAASIGIPGAAPYCAAKAALESLVKTIHSETSFYKTKVECISFMPGRIYTEMQAEMRSYSKEQFPMVDRYKALHEKQELQSPEKVAKLFCENIMEGKFESGKSYSIDNFR